MTKLEQNIERIEAELAQMKQELEDSKEFKWDYHRYEPTRTKGNVDMNSIKSVLRVLQAVSCRCMLKVRV